MALLHDVLAQDLLICDLWVSKVHHFVEQLVDEHEIVAQRLLGEVAKVILEDLDDLVQELERQRALMWVMRRHVDGTIPKSIPSWGCCIQCSRDQVVLSGKSPRRGENWAKKPLRYDLESLKTAQRTTAEKTPKR